MSKYQYIEVFQPDRGLDQSRPAGDISPRAGSDCQNVYFADGRIKKRFGWQFGADAYGGTNLEVCLLNEQICHLCVHEFIFNEATANITRNLYAFSLNNVYRWNATDAQWEPRTEVLQCDFDTAGYSNSYGAGTVNPATATFVGTGLNDFHVGRESEAGAVSYAMRVKIATAAAPDTYKISRGDGADGTWWGGGVWTNNEAGAAAINCHTTFTPQPAANPHITFRFRATTGHTAGDYWNFNLVNGTSTKSQDAANKQEGTASAKFAIDANCTIGTMGYIIYYFEPTYGEAKIQGLTRVSVWVRTSVALNKGDFQLHLMPDAGDLSYLDGGALFASSDLPAIAADGAFHHCVLDFDPLDNPDSLATGTGFYIFLYRAVNKGAMDIWLDDMKLVRGLAMDDDDTESEQTISLPITVGIDAVTKNYLVFTNFTPDHLVRYIASSTGNCLMLPDGDDYNTTRISHEARALSAYGYHLSLLTTREESSGTEYDFEKRVRWSDLNDADVWDTGTSGNNSLTDLPGRILNAWILGGNEYIFTTGGCVRRVYVGGETGIYSWTTVFVGDGLLATKMGCVVQDSIIYAGLHHLYRFTGSGEPPIFGREVENKLYAGLESDDGQYHKRSFMFTLDSYDLLAVCYPHDAEYPNKALLYDWTLDSWTFWNFGTQNITAAVSYDRLTGTNIQKGCKFGNSNGELRDFDFDYFNDGAEAIDAWWTSKAFAHPQNRNEVTRWREVIIEAAGDYVEVQYSTDGKTFRDCGQLSLTDDLKRYTLTVNQASQYLYLKFKNAEAESEFQISYFAIGYDGESKH